MTHSSWNHITLLIYVPAWENPTLKKNIADANLNILRFSCLFSLIHFIHHEGICTERKSGPAYLCLS